jgi:hypothetical protein
MKVQIDGWMIYHICQTFFSVFFLFCSNSTPVIHNRSTPENTQTSKALQNARTEVHSGKGKKEN